jgi:hypothetical protein
VLSAPGGLFELVAGAYLLVKGFEVAVPKVVATSELAPRSAAARART